VRFARLDPDKTAPFHLGPAGGPPVLLVHGFTGSPWDMRPLGEALGSHGFRVRGLRLPGHGTTPEALLRVGHQDWTLAVEDALLALHAEGGPVRVAGLSMGALLAIQGAVQHPDKVAALALLAPALRLRGPRMAVAKVLCQAGVLHRAWPWLRKDGTDLSDPAELAEAPILPAFPSARLRDLFHLQGKARAALPGVRCAALVVTAQQDHVVAPECGAEATAALTGAAAVRHLSLSVGFHILTRDRDRALLFEEVAGFFSRPPGARAPSSPGTPAASASRRPG
jgi:carboxylesterase